MNFQEFCIKQRDHHLKERKRLDSDILLHVLQTYKDGKLKISPVISYQDSPMDHMQKVIDSLQPEMYLICSEVWAHSPQNPKEFTENYRWGEISQMDEKFECVSFIGKTLDGKEEFGELHRIFRKDEKIFNYQNMDMDAVLSKKLT